MPNKSKSEKKMSPYYQYVILKKVMIKKFHILFLDTNLSLMYTLNTVKFLNNLVDDIF